MSILLIFSLSLVIVATFYLGMLAERESARERMRRNKGCIR